MQAQVVGQRVQRFRRAEPDGHQGNPAGKALLHLDQVLLTGQSIPVPDEAQDGHTVELAQLHPPTGPSVDESDAGQRTRNAVLTHRRAPAPQVRLDARPGRRSP